MVTAAPPDRSVLGRRSRSKGQSFERVVAEQFRVYLPKLRDTLSVRRSSQSERAYEADLIIEGPGVPDALCKLWVECQHANEPDPPNKYAQAIRDSELATRRTGKYRTPCVIWRKSKSRQINFTTELPWLNGLLGVHGDDAGRGLLVTISLSEFLQAFGSQLA